jgi:hypothetical protein
MAMAIATCGPSKAARFGEQGAYNEDSEWGRGEEKAGLTETSFMPAGSKGKGLRTLKEAMCTVPIIGFFLLVKPTSNICNPRSAFVGTE